MMDCDICLAPQADLLVSTEAGRVLGSALGVRAGHVIVATARHVESFTELETGELVSFMKLLANALKAAEHAKPVSRYYVLRVGDKSPHLHFHLIPTSAGDTQLGSFIFGEDGWASTIKQRSSQDERDVFSREFKGILGSL
jgi:diadenosine tetraphosphate (Ap4A) HIT family hydrolase